MRKRFYAWLRQRFLPEWARRQLLEENEALRLQLAEARQRVDQLENYIDGIHDGLRRQRRIVIYTQGGGGGQ